MEPLLCNNFQTSSKSLSIHYSIAKEKMKTFFPPLFPTIEKEMKANFLFRLNFEVHFDRLLLQLQTDVRKEFEHLTIRFPSPNGNFFLLREFADRIYLRVRSLGKKNFSVQITPIAWYITVEDSEHQVISLQPLSSEFDHLDEYPSSFANLLKKTDQYRAYQSINSNNV
jgi:hypothetical protein